MNMSNQLIVVNEIRVSSGKDGFTSLECDWSKLAALYGHHFLHFPAWYAARLAVMESPNNLIFAALYSQDKLHGVVSLQQRKIVLAGVAIPSLELAYPNEMGLCDFLLSPGVTLNLGDLNRALRRSGYYYFGIKFTGAGVASCAYSQLSKARLPRKLSHCTKFLDVQRGRTSFYEGYSSKFKRNIRRKRSKALESGNLDVRRFKNTEAVRAFQDFLRLESSGWKGREATSIAQQSDKLLYYNTLIESYSNDGVHVVNLLYLNDRVIAAQLGVQVATVLYLLKIAYDEECADISPGYLLIDELITELDDPNFLSKISFVTGVGWIDRWKPSEECVCVYFDGGNKIINYAIAQAIKVRELLP